MRPTHQAARVFSLLLLVVGEEERRGQLRLEGLLLRVPVPADTGDAKGHRARLRVRPPPHRRRPGGAPPPGAGLWQLPGPRAHARGEGDAPPLRPLLLPLPQRRVRRRRVRPHHRVPRDPARRHRHRQVPAAAPAQPQHERRHRLPRAHAARLPHALVQVDRQPVRGAQQLCQLRRPRHADRRRREVQPARASHRRRAQKVRPHRRDAPGSVVAEDRQTWRPQLQLHDQRPVLLRLALHHIIANDSATSTY